MGRYVIGQSYWQAHYDGGALTKQYATFANHEAADTANAVLAWRSVVPAACAAKVGGEPTTDTLGEAAGGQQPCLRASARAPPRNFPVVCLCVRAMHRAGSLTASLAFAFGHVRSSFFLLTALTGGRLSP